MLLICTHNIHEWRQVEYREEDRVKNLSKTVKQESFQKAHMLERDEIVRNHSQTSLPALNLVF
jgi:hypothetical protein